MTETDMLGNPIEHVNEEQIEEPICATEIADAIKDNAEHILVPVYRHKKKTLKPLLECRPREIISYTTYCMKEGVLPLEVSRKKL